MALGTLDIQEYRGIKNLVACIISDDSNSYGPADDETVFPVAGVAELTVSGESDSESHYYDNYAAITIDATGADTITCSCSALDIEVFAKLTGQTYDEDTHTMITSTAAKKPYLAIGYVTEDTAGNELWVWRNKVKVSTTPEFDHVTQDDGTDASGQEIEFSGIETTYKDTTTNDHFASVVLEATKAGFTDDDMDTFFSTVQTPTTVLSGSWNTTEETEETTEETTEESTEEETTV